MRSRSLAALLAVLLLGAQSPTPAPGGERFYKVSGRDTVQLGAAGRQQRVDYSGIEHVAIADGDNGARYSSHVSYVRGDASDVAHRTASFVSEITADGSEHDIAGSDPDEMTVLHQPFTIALDRATRLGIAAMRGSIPFDFTAPVGTTTVDGKLQRVASAPGTLAVAFDASGPFSGQVSDRPGETITGRLHMRGSALYLAADGSLISLQVRVEIDGSVDGGAKSAPIAIVHQRAFEAESADQERAAQR
ncbi:MAG: hypothetical protein ACREM8_10870 [Vulcanimicrobiaceae bacterium]